MEVKFYFKWKNMYVCVRPTHQVVALGACHFDSSFRMVMEYACP